MKCDTFKPAGNGKLHVQELKEETLMKPLTWSFMLIQDLKAGDDCKH